MQVFRKTRIAPTPSGYLHIGNILSFAITAALAEKTGAKIFLRIDDLDRDRTVREFVEDIFDTLNFLEIPWHEGPRNYEQYKREYAQEHRQPLYDSALKQLWEEGHLFACTCTRSQIPGRVYTGTCMDKHLPQDTKDACLRLRTNNDEVIEMKTPEGIATIPFPSDMPYFIMRRKDGITAYQLASVIDDIHFDVDLVVRGDDLLHSTLAQLQLASILKLPIFQQTTFHHHKLVIGADGLKLSKSAGATSIRFLRNEYKTRIAVLRKIGQFLGIKTEINSWKDIALRMDDK